MSPDMVDVWLPVARGLVVPSAIYKISSSVMATAPALHGHELTQILAMPRQLLVRAPIEHLDQVLRLDCARLPVSGHEPLMLGRALVCPRLTPSMMLTSRLVVYKRSKAGAKHDGQPGLLGRQGEDFLQAVKDACGRLSIRPEVKILAGAPKQLRFKGLTFTGYPVTFLDLSPDESVVLQAHGLGGFKSYGCGVFVRKEDACWSLS